LGGIGGLGWGVVSLLSVLEGIRGGGGGKNTYDANGQSGLASVWITSGHVAARRLYAVYADATTHFPPSAAAARVCQARMSPVASVWKGYRCVSLGGCAGEKGVLGGRVLEIGGGVG
jgi:hypothetical protein